MSATVWITGLPSAGKTTLAIAIESALADAGQPVVRLDGDAVRSGLCSDLGFSVPDRRENVRRVACVARLLADSAVISVCALVSPLREHRALARSLHDGVGFVEVFADTPLAECERRDSSGLYERARGGTLVGLTGVDAPYEPPLVPEVHLVAPWDVGAAAANVIGLLPLAAPCPAGGRVTGQP